ncbi:unnamed protein product, partial [Ixodes persulcatus]
TWQVKTPASCVDARSIASRAVNWSLEFLGTREVQRERKGTSGSTGKPSLNQRTRRALDPTAMHATISSSPTRGERDTSIASTCIAAGKGSDCRNPRSTVKGPSLPTFSASSSRDRTAGPSS